ncbi:type II secretion system protein N [Rhodoferax sp.]|uniref:type II secretion system protein N n=1 Tax=Rhodoferax sp. TaxID=50421 RepID=UPI0027223A3B|nr:type II secretion system protein N [Rhodoferax sp.]MDO8320704.1 type II secretion system protein N [Rhodoferax sp.]MDP2679401.1 type II secretion system protein N [Rhodoferax sp.]
MKLRQKSTPWGWALGGVLLGLTLSTVLFAPARWLSSLLRQVSQGQVLLMEARGTVWTGSARLTVTGGLGSQEAATLPGRLAWVFSPGLGAAKLQLNADCCMQQAWAMQLQPRWNGFQVTLSDAQSQWPAKLLAGLGTPWNTIQPQGELLLSTRGLTLAWAAGRLLLTGVAQLDAMNLSSHLSTLRPMGSYRFSLTGGTPISLALTTLQGSLQLSGSGQWVGGQLRFNGEASAVPQHQAALSNLLNLIGRRNGARSIIKVG